MKKEDFKESNKSFQNNNNNNTSSQDDESINFVYNVVTTNHDFQEKHLKTFSDLQDALQYVNLKCSEWDFSPKNGLNKDGCGTCSAH